MVEPNQASLDWRICKFFVQAPRLGFFKGEPTKCPRTQGCSWVGQGWGEAYLALAWL